MKKFILAAFAALALAAAPARAGSQPQRALDECYGKPLAVHVKGWAYDPDVSSQSIDVHVYLYTDSGCTSQYGGIRVLTANVSRPDVNQVKGVPGDHGFDADVSVADAGDYWVKVFAIDATGDGDPQIGSTRSVTVTERPGYDDEFTVGDLKYTITSSDYEPPTVEVSAANTGISGVVTIPDTVSWWGTDYAVTHIQSFGFQDCTSITGVSIGNNVASIGDAAFYSCDAITEVTVGRGVTSIGDSVFAFCYDLATVTLLPTTPPSIGQDVFENCYDLAEIIVPVSAYDAYVRSWGDYAGLIKDANGTEYSLLTGRYSEYVTEVRLLQLLKAYSPMLVTDSGMVTEVRLVQLSNVEPSILVTASGMVMEVKLLQPENAPSPMVVTELGMVTEVSLLQEIKAHSAMYVTVLGMMTEVRLKLKLKAWYPIPVTV